MRRRVASEVGRSAATVAGVTNTLAWRTMGSLVYLCIRQKTRPVALTLATMSSANQWVTQTAAGVENSLGFRVSGTQGSLEWHQERPTRLTFKPLKGPVLVYTPNWPGSLPAVIGAIGVSGLPEESDIELARWAAALADAG